MIIYDKLWETMGKKGITKYVLTEEHHMSKSLLHRLKKNEGVNMNTINTLCRILDCRIEDIATYYDDEEYESEFKRS
ncbi:MAG: helix-turn-helix transcriptional regulator [Lachnospiraceae bacterium]|nr:helix-turn-helix transcriptional regulator [Lachnospiraceae bacterium]